MNRKEKSNLLLGVFACLLFSSLIRLSFASVVFDFNASLNGAAPMYSIPFPVI